LVYSLLVLVLHMFLVSVSVLVACQFYWKFILPPMIFGVNSMHSADNLFYVDATLYVA